MTANKQSVVPLPHQRWNAKTNLTIGIVLLVACGVYIILRLTGIIH